MALFASPLILAVAIYFAQVIRKKMQIKSKIHFIDFIGVIIALIASYFAIPKIY